MGAPEDAGVLEAIMTCEQAGEGRGLVALDFLAVLGKGAGNQGRERATGLSSPQSILSSSTEVAAVSMCGSGAWGVKESGSDKFDML